MSHPIYHRSIQTKRRISKANIRYTVLTAFFSQPIPLNFHDKYNKLICVCVFWLKYNNLQKFHQIFVLLNEFECVRCCNQWKIPIHEFKSVFVYEYISYRVSIAHTGLNRHGFHCKSSRLYDGRCVCECECHVGGIRGVSNRRTARTYFCIKINVFTQVCIYYIVGCIRTGLSICFLLLVLFWFYFSIQIRFMSLSQLDSRIFHTYLCTAHPFIYNKKYVWFAIDWSEL